MAEDARRHGRGPAAGSGKRRRDEAAAAAPPDPLDPAAPPPPAPTGVLGRSKRSKEHLHALPLAAQPAPRAGRRSGARAEGAASECARVPVRACWAARLAGAPRAARGGMGAKEGVRVRCVGRALLGLGPRRCGWGGLRTAWWCALSTSDGAPACSVRGPLSQSVSGSVTVTALIERSQSGPHRAAAAAPSSPH